MQKLNWTCIKPGIFLVETRIGFYMVKTNEDWVYFQISVDGDNFKIAEGKGGKDEAEADYFHRCSEVTGVVCKPGECPVDRESLIDIYDALDFDTNIGIFNILNKHRLLKAMEKISEAIWR